MCFSNLNCLFMETFISQPPYCNCVYNIKDKVWDVQIYFKKYY